MPRARASPLIRPYPPNCTPNHLHSHVPNEGRSCLQTDTQGRADCPGTWAKQTRWFAHAEHPSEKFVTETLPDNPLADTKRADLPAIANPPLDHATDRKRGGSKLEARATGCTAYWLKEASRNGNIGTNN